MTMAAPNKQQAINPEWGEVAALEVAGEPVDGDNGGDSGEQGGDHRGAADAVAVVAEQVGELVEAGGEDDRGGEQEAVAGGTTICPGRAPGRSPSRRRRG